jgi:Ca2+-binding EF-hand superfamily protein
LKQWLTKFGVEDKQRNLLSIITADFTKKEEFKIAEEINAVIKATFSDFDTNGNGLISPDELRRALNLSSLSTNLSESEIIGYIE